jgi:hypothetical protein
MRSKDTQNTLFLYTFIMSRSIALSMLAQGNTGNEILSILDVIATEESEQSIATPTLDVIEF